ncbi:MAG: serpin family protein [Bacteroidales bacterium]|nr:serpin family protein [Bacteroidales bacterium]
MKYIQFLFVLLVLSIISCNKEKDPGIENPKPIDLKTGSEAVIQSMNEFGLDIFQRLLNNEADNENLFISPTSISLALAMTLNGANNATEDSMVHALRMDLIDPDAINQTFKDLMTELKTCDDKVLLEIANSIWSREGFPVEQEFIDVNETYYDAEVSELDFDASDAVPTINGWVAENTHDKITKIIDKIDPGTIMFLINAIYFKGSWSIEFEENHTYDCDFYLANGTTKQVAMMNFTEEVGYLENDLFKACELDYGRGNFSMIVLLPNEGIPADTILAEAQTGMWDVWTSSFAKTEISLGLPKFKFEYEKELKEILGLMGMGIAFEAGLADFTGINPDGNLFISKVKHKTFVDVNEEGTEAAAVTVVGVDLTSAPGTYMYVDRPFLFVIREKITNTLVFMGRVAEPEYEQ